MTTEQELRIKAFELVPNRDAKMTIDVIESAEKIYNWLLDIKQTTSIKRKR